MVRMFAYHKDMGFKLNGKIKPHFMGWGCVLF